MLREINLRKAKLNGDLLRQKVVLFYGMGKLYNCMRENHFIYAVVESPFQLLNIKEFLFQELEDASVCKVFVINLVNTANLEQIFRVANELGFHIEVLISFPNFTNGVVSKFIFSVKFFFQLLKIRSSRSSLLMVGDLGSFVSRTFIKRFKPLRIVAVDDGNASIQMHGRFLDGMLLANRVLFERVFDLLFCSKEDLYRAERLSFFTKYMTPLKASTKWFVENRSIYLRSLIQNAGQSLKVFFIGNNIAEIGIVSEKFYLDSLGLISTRYENYEVLYFPHRREDPEKVARVLALTGWGLHEQRLPFELEMCQLGRPLVLTTFFSSVIDNMANLNLGLEIEVFILPSSELNLQREKILQIYQHYRSIGIDCVPIPSFC